MNKNIFNFLFIAVLLVGLNSCKDETEESVITNVPFTIESVDPNVSLSEKSQLVTVNFSLDADQIVATGVQIAVDPVRSTATAGEDFIFETTVVEIPAYVRAGSFQYEILEDLDAEGDETISFILSGVHDPFGASNTLDYVVTIRDSIYTTLNLSFDWEGIAVFDGDEYPLCPNVDMDIIVFDNAGDFYNFDGATAACPEVVIVDDTWADGDYLFTSNMWNNEFDDLMINTPFPITVSATKGGVFRETFVPEDIWTSEDMDAVHDGNDSEFRDLFKLNKAGTVYTISNPDGSIIVTGFTNNPRPGKASTANGLVR